MIDGSFLIKVVQKQTKSFPSAEQVYQFALDCIDKSDEEILRIYYYDCAPYGIAQTNPLSGHEVDFSLTPLHNQQKAFQDKLACMDHIAFRRGVLSFSGWRIGERALQSLMKAPRSLEAKDLVPDLKQKRVDIKIGLDIAWLASKCIVERIILIAGDADLIPAMKFARKEGVQVILITLGNRIQPEMREHTDIFRKTMWPKTTIANNPKP